MGHYGIGELTAVTILAELGDARRFSSSRHAVRYAGLDITVHPSDQRRAPGHLSRQGPPALRWALFEAAQAARRPGSPDRAYYDQAAAASAATAPASRSRASYSSAASTRCANSETRRWRPSEKTSVRALPSVTPMHRGRLPACRCRHARVDGLQRPSGRTASRGNTPSPITSPARRPRPRTEISLGARAHRTPPLTAPAPNPPLNPRHHRALDAEPRHR